MADPMRTALNEMTDEILKVRNECFEHARDYPHRFAQASFDYGYQMAFNTLYEWLVNCPQDLLAHKLKREFESYVGNKDDWVMQLHHQPWNEEEA